MLYVLCTNILQLVCVGTFFTFIIIESNFRICHNHPPNPPNHPVGSKPIGRCACALTQQHAQRSAHARLQKTKMRYFKLNFVTPKYLAAAVTVASRLTPSWPFRPTKPYRTKDSKPHHTMTHTTERRTCAPVRCCAPLQRRRSSRVTHMCGH